MKSFIFGGNILSDSEGKISYKECCQRHNKTVVKNVTILLTLRLHFEQFMIIKILKLKWPYFLYIKNYIIRNEFNIHMLLIFFL